MITAQEYKKLLEEENKTREHSLSVAMDYILKDLEKSFEEVYCKSVDNMDKTIKIQICLNNYSDKIRAEISLAKLFEHWHNEVYLKEEVRHIIIKHFESYGYSCILQQTDGDYLYVELGVE